MDYFCYKTKNRIPILEKEPIITKKRVLTTLQSGIFILTEQVQLEKILWINMKLLEETS